MAGILTDSRIRGIKPKDHAYYVWQPATTKGEGSFGLKIHPSGKKTFVYKYVRNGQRKFVSLGVYPQLTLAQAREKSLKAAADAGNVDVVNKELSTLKQLFDAYRDNQEKRGIRGFAQDYNRLLQVLESRHVNPNMLAKDVTSAHIQRILAEVIERGAVAGSNKIRTVLHGAFNFGLFADYDPANLNGEIRYGLTLNPVAVVPKQKGTEKAGDRYLSWKELKCLLGELSKDDCGMPFDCVMLTLLCIFTAGQRPHELKNNTRDMIDFDSRTLTVPPELFKLKCYHVVPLCQSAIDILQTIVNHNDRNTSHEGDTGNFIFPRETKEGCLTSDEFAKQIRLFCKHKNFRPFTPRDLRRTFKTLGAEMGLTLELRDRVQGHKIPGTSTKHYDRYAYLKEKRAAIELWEEKLLSL
ncbi:MAG: tyrosine-type recombinase/integrase [Enterobacteriaceae bacterium]